MGVDKARFEWGGRGAADLLADLARAAGARLVISAGQDLGMPFVLDPAPRAGPVAGVMAAAAVLRDAGLERALLLAVDAPAVGAADVEALLAGPEPGATFGGFPLPAVVTLAALPADAAAGWPLRRLADRAGLTALPCPAEVEYRIRGVNTQQERAELIAAWPSVGMSFGIAASGACLATSRNLLTARDNNGLSPPDEDA
jgi:molybdopterin-guanine dinucleotide biosynthesis protein A